MGRFWSLVFLMVPVLGVGLFVVAALPDGALLEDHWFPEDASQHGYTIDGLFLFILFLTGVIFIGTGLALFWFLWSYDAVRRPGGAKYTHGDHTIEVVWSVLPAATLLFIAIYQMNVWADNKLRKPVDPGPDGQIGTPDDPILAGADSLLGTADDIPKSRAEMAEVTGRQFEWRIRYAGSDQIIGTPDDLFTVNDLHVPLDEEIVLSITSADVLHSFFLPNFRVKQDVVPGMQQWVWFRPVREGQFDIVCAELCGWGHYKMKGRITVESPDEFQAYLEELRSEQNQTEEKGSGLFFDRSASN